MRIAVIDNCADDRAELKNEIEEAGRKTCLSLGISEFENGEDFLAAADEEAFDLAFLDIYMEGMNGIETAERLRGICPGCLFVFVTVSSAYALDGFRVRALHYLVKPFSSGDIEKVLKEAAMRLKEGCKILVQDGNTPISIPLSSICYIICQGHYLMLHTSRGIIRWRQTFAALCEMLAPYPQFFTCNRGMLVNLEHVKKLVEGSNCFLMDDNTSLPVRKNSRAEARRRYLDFFFCSDEKKK